MQELSLRQIVVGRAVKLFAAICLSLCFGCGSMTAKELSVSDLAGKWSGKLVGSLKRDNSTLPDGQLTLNADGEFEMGGAFGLFTIPPAKPEVGGGSGTWKLLKRDGRQRIQLAFEKVIGSQKVPVPYGYQLEIDSGRSGAILYYFIGDPDSGDKVKFQKVSSTN